jgi:hypothetical protein
MALLESQLQHQQLENLIGIIFDPVIHSENTKGHICSSSSHSYKKWKFCKSLLLEVQVANTEILYCRCTKAPMQRVEEVVLHSMVLIVLGHFFSL